MIKRFVVVSMMGALALVGCSDVEEVRKAEVTEGKVQAAEIPDGSQDFRIDVKNSKFKWEASKVTGTHYGEVQISSGQVFVRDGEILNGDVKMDMTTISNEDIDDPLMNEKFLTHMKSSDFFDVEKYPSASFQIVKVVKNDDVENGTHIVSGNLMIKGITKMITFPAMIEIGESEVKAQAEFSVDRTEWNIVYGSGKFFEGLGDNLIDDEFKVKLDLVGRRA